MIAGSLARVIFYFMVPLRIQSFSPAKPTLPSISTLALHRGSGTISPRIQLSSAVLPLPFSPRMMTNEPLGISKLISLRMQSLIAKFDLDFGVLLEVKLSSSRSIGLLSCLSRGFEDSLPRVSQSLFFLRFSH